MLRTCSCRRAKSLCNSTISLLAAKVKEGQIKRAGNSVRQKVIGSPHERDGWAVPPVADGPGLPGPYPILLPCGEVRAAVLLKARLVVVGALRRVLGGGGAPVAESQVVLGRTALVAMALDGDAGVREAGDDGLQGVGVLGQRGAGIFADIVLVVVE